MNKNFAPGERVYVTHNDFYGKVAIVIGAAYTHEDVPKGVPPCISGTVYAVWLIDNSEPASLIHEEFLSSNPPRRG
jgi:hypothetical protein